MLIKSLLNFIYLLVFSISKAEYCVFSTAKESNQQKKGEYLNSIRICYNLQ